MRKQNIMLFIILCITQGIQAMNLLSTLETKIGNITDPKLNPYNLTHAPEWHWPQTAQSQKGHRIYDRAGGLPYAWHNGTVYILLGLETAKGVWTDFTGSADWQEGDKAPIQTAAREFAEETNIIFYKTAKGKNLKANYSAQDIKLAIRNMLEPKQLVSQGPIIRGIARGLKPFDQWLYFIEVTYVPTEALNQSGRGPGSEMSEFRWISVEDLLKILQDAHRNEQINPFYKDSRYLYKPLLNTLLRKNVLLFLKDLYQQQLDLNRKQIKQEPALWSPNLVEALELLRDSLQHLTLTF